MANEMFTQLPLAATANLSDIICAVQGYVSPSSPGQSVQQTLQQVLSLTQGRIVWTNVASSTQAMISNSGYIINNGSLVTLTLPSISNVGDQINIVGRSSSGWLVNYGTGQNIIIGTSASTATTGSIASTHAADSIILICTRANLEWTALSLISSGITIV